MSKLICNLNIYMEELNIAECLSAIRRYLPEAQITVIDGAYKTWQQAVKLEAAWNMEQGFQQIGQNMLKFLTPCSNDKTLEICKQFNVENLVECPKDIYGQPEAWECEWKKRNEFFKFGNPGDYYFVIDADEVLEGHPDQLLNDCYNVMLYRDDDIAPYPVQRIYKHYEGIEIKGAHHAVWIKGVLHNKEMNPTIGGCKLVHYFNRRGNMDRNRSLAKGAYYRRGLAPEEADFRAIHSI